MAAAQSDIATIVGNIAAQRICQQRKEISLDEQLSLLQKCRARLLTRDDPEYPNNLKKIFDPPLVLFMKGGILPEDELSLAIVGTRMASLYGLTIAAKFGFQLGEYGFTITSGGARGIDSSAHRGALKANARTIAVLGCGLDIVYPQENARLFEAIAEKGALLSEFPMGIRPCRQNFPRRNRLISGLSLGVVVVEAPQKSGALITVSSALEQGREVFCVPGQADSFNMKGSHRLLKEGAKLTEGVEDILEELRPLLKNRLNHKHKPLPEKLSPEEAGIFNLLSDKPKSLEEVAGRSCLPISRVSSFLTQLEIKGLVKELPGKLFSCADLNSKKECF